MCVPALPLLKTHPTGPRWQVRPIDADILSFKSHLLQRMISWDYLSAEAAGTVFVFSVFHTVVLLELSLAGTKERALLVLGMLGDR